MRDDDHLDLEIPVRQPRLRTGAHRRVFWIDPFVPDRRDLVEIIEMCKPDRDVRNLAFVRTNARQSFFNGPEDLSCLLGSAGFWIERKRRNHRHVRGVADDGDRC